MMEMLRKGMKKGWLLAAAFGFFLAALLECGLAWRRVGQGYGSGKGAVSLTPDSYRDYAVSGEFSENWAVSGGAPHLILHPGCQVGHIHIEFQEPLAQETETYLYYSKTDVFDRYQRRDGYLLCGTKEADITIPPGEWNSLRLDVRGDFVLAGLEAWEPLPLSEVSPKQAWGQVSWLRFFLLFLLLSASMALILSTWGKRKQEAKGGRILYLDGVRTLAAVLVIVIHVLEPMEGAYSSHSTSKWYLLFLGVMIAAYSCNQLFLMLSGALLLPYRRETMSAFLQKRLLKVVLPLWVYSLFYIKLPCFSRASFGVWAAYYLKSVCTGQVRMGPHLWLIYEMVSLYILVIPLRALLGNAPEQTEKQLAFLTVAFFGIHTASLATGNAPGISSFLSGWIGVFLMGYFLTKPWMRRYDRLWLIGGCAALLLGVYTATVRDDYKQVIFGPSVFGLFMASGIFVAMMRLERFFQAAERILCFGSRYSYSVLLVHWYVLYHIIFSTGICSNMSNMALAAFSVAACIALSLAISAVVNHTFVAVLERAIQGALKGPVWKGP